LVCSPLACSKKAPPPKPGELTAEEREKLRQNAAKVYQQLVTEYPDSDYAAKARERLDAIAAQQRK
jgi:outer membrane protein assembly factor BamD (BamD/ComL family)